MKIINLNNYTLLFLINFVLLFWSEHNFGQSEDTIELVSVEFIGNDYFDTDDLEEIIISQESSSWISQFFDNFSSFGSPPSYFDSLNIQDDLNILSNYYKANGFFKSKITANFNIDSKEKEASLQFNIIENYPSFIRDYNFKGLENLPSRLYSELVGFMNIDSSNQYSEQLIEVNSNTVISYLQNKGYMLVQSFPAVVEVDTVINVVDISVNFQLGNRYRISEVKVEKSGPGQDLVNEELIENIANITSEKFYSYNDLKLAQIRLYRTNLFSSAVIAGSIQDTVGNYVPVNIITKVGLLNELSPELILLSEDNVLKVGLGLTFSKKNFLGEARKLTIGTSAVAEDITEFIQEANLASNNIFGYADARVGIEQPFIFGKPINTLLETYYTLEKKKNQWNASIYGAKLNLNFELPPYIYITAFSTYLTWQKSKYIFTEEYLLDKLPDSLVNGALTTNSTSAILGARLVANKTDDFIFPTEGYSISLLAEDGNALPYLFSKIGNFNFNQAGYYKFVLNTTAYFPYMANFFDSFGMKFKVGNIHTYSGDKNEIPYNQRFSAGGSNSIRGWQANILPNTEYVLPQNPTNNEIENIARNITPGGFFILEGSIEGRDYLTEKIGFAAFIDYGNVWNDFKQFRFDEVAIAAGFGFRYYLDFAPIRLDFGFKAYDPDDRRSFFTRINHSPFFKNVTFQIGIGEAF